MIAQEPELAYQVGFVKLYRTMREWEWYTDSKTVHLFLHILLSANWKPKKWQNVELQRGQFITSYDHLSRETGLTKQEVRTRLKRLEKTGEINTATNTRYTLITVCKYDTYQQQDDNTNTPTNTPLTHHQHTSNTPLTPTKEGKERKEYKEGKNIGLQHLEQLAKTHGLDLKYVEIQKESAEEWYSEKGKELTVAKLNSWLAKDDQSKMNPSNPNRITPPYLNRRLA